MQVVLEGEIQACNRAGVPRNTTLHHGGEKKQRHDLQLSKIKTIHICIVLLKEKIYNNNKGNEHEHAEILQQYQKNLEKIHLLSYTVEK